MAVLLGIDLGTTFSAMATFDETGRPQIVHNSEGSNITPSCVSVEVDGATIVGVEAQRQWSLDPETAFGRFKRDMGTSKTQTVNGREFAPTLLSSLVLKKLKQDAEKVLGSIDQAVVTIPANFAHEARDATMTAAKEAGLNIQYIINEPTAAALFYAYKSGEAIQGNYAVYDLGGGTFDISIIHVNGKDVEVLASDGVSRLGGDDFDQALQKIVQKKFHALTGENLTEQDFTRGDAEEEKKSLSKRSSVTVRVARQMIEINRAEFEEAISRLITQAEMLCTATLDEAKITNSELSGVLLVGGSTRIPAVKESIKRVFGQDPIDSVNVDEVVALGAAIYAAVKAPKGSLLPGQDDPISEVIVTEMTGKYFGTIAGSLDPDTGEEITVNSPIISRGTRIPCSVSEPFYTYHDGQEAVLCRVTESPSHETDPRFVKIIWEGMLTLPAGRPAGQEIKVAFSYDENQIMKVSFLDVASGAQIQQDLSFVETSGTTASEIDKFMVE